MRTATQKFVATEIAQYDSGEQNTEFIPTREEIEQSRILVYELRRASKKKSPEQKNSGKEQTHE